MDKANYDKELIAYLTHLKELSKQRKREIISPKKYTCTLCQDKGYVNVFAKDTSELIGVKPCKCRTQKLVHKHLATSGVDIVNYKHMQLANFPEDTEEARKMKQLACRFIKNHKQGEGIAYTGKSGTMKTTICIAICQELTRCFGESHRYFSYRTEIQKLKNLMYKQSTEFANAMQELYTCENLYIDDLFKFAETKRYTTSDGNYKIEIQNQDLQIIFDIVNNRMLNKLTTIFSSEYSITEINNYIDEALGSRILKMCRNYGMKCSGENRRLK